VTVTVNGTATVFAAGTPVTYTDGATISFGGVSFTISGTPADQDNFTVGPNTSGVGDSRNGALLAGLQTKNILDNGKATFQTTYAQMVNYVGTKAREAQISGTAADAAVKQATNAQQACRASTSMKRRPTCCAISKRTRPAARSCKWPASYSIPCSVLAIKQIG
jgi:flagellar hook-associated protein 1 FlgK